MNPLTYAAGKQRASESAVSPQPTITELKQAWIEEATRVGLIERAQNVVGLPRLKNVLGPAYASLVPGCDALELRAEGLWAIQSWRQELEAA